MKKTKTPPTEEQIQDSIRLRKLFADRAGMSQLEFGQAYGVGNQGMVWQYLNADKPKGSVLNVFAAIKFAEGLQCRVSDFSPSIQEEIDRIASFATKTEKDAAMKKETPSFADPGKAVSKEMSFQQVDIGRIAPKQPVQREIEVGGLYVQAPQQTQAAIDVLLLPPEDRAVLAEASEVGGDAFAGIRLLERNAGAALSALHERKKIKNGTKPD